MMKKSLLFVAVTLMAALLATGCQDYDDSELRTEMKELDDRIAQLEAWCRTAQDAIDYVGILKEEMKQVNGVASVSPFTDDKGEGFTITFTDGKEIKLYHGTNGTDGKDGDTLFGHVVVNRYSVEFFLADGGHFVLQRLPEDIGFDSYTTRTVAQGDTLWTVMNQDYAQQEFAAFTAAFTTDDGIATSVVTRSAAGEGNWKVKAIAPEFDTDGKLVRPAGIVFKEAPSAGGTGVLKATLVNGNGTEQSASLVVKVAPDYLSFTAMDDAATVRVEIVGTLDAPALMYSTNLTDWDTYDFGTCPTITLTHMGDKVYFRNADKADTFSRNYDNHIHFDLGEKHIAAGGNIMSLVDHTCQSLTIPCEGCFSGLFDEEATLVTAPKLPATELTSNCYGDMFVDCISLTQAPELPATELARACYESMFRNCTSLAETPVLPATKITSGCYFRMFESCESLKEAPELPAKELAEGCYYAMFFGCTNLENAPALPAMKLAPECYTGTFADCTSLAEAPELPATELAEGCYYAIFQGTAIEEAPELPATELKASCYLEMFLYCKSLKKAPRLPATKLTSECYADMFSGCTQLEGVSVAFTQWDDEHEATRGWLADVPDTGTFRCPEGLDTTTRDASHVPAGWSVSHHDSGKPDKTSARSGKAAPTAQDNGHDQSQKKTTTRTKSTAFAPRIWSEYKEKKDLNF